MMRAWLPKAELRQMTQVYSYLGIFWLSIIAGCLINIAADQLAGRWATGGAALVIRRQPAWSRRDLAVCLVALALGWLALHAGDTLAEQLWLAGIAWFYLAVAVIDLEHRLVLNRMLLAAAPLLLLSHWAGGGPALLAALLGGMIGLGSFLALALARPGSIGMGDVKLAGVIGLTVGVGDLPLALLVGTGAGALASLWVLCRSRFRPGQHMAYAPYLVVGVWTVLYARAGLTLFWGVL
jgi:prepilin signal peptidase PulO-like enzyme (type II secretory pathway)